MADDPIAPGDEITLSHAVWAYANGTGFATVQAIEVIAMTSRPKAAPRASLAALACVLLAAAGCGSSSSATTPSPSPTTRVFVGEVTGTDAQVAVIATATHARLYFCGGDASFDTKTHWIPSATLGGSQLTPSPADSGGWSVAGQLDESGANGTVVMGAAGTFSFHANPVAEATIAGLYEAQGPCGHLGVIVSQASPAAAATSQGACLPAVGMGMASVEQVNPIHPVERTTDGSIAVLVSGMQVLVRAAAAPAD